MRVVVIFSAGNEQAFTLAGYPSDKTLAAQTVSHDVTTFLREIEKQGVDKNINRQSSSLTIDQKINILLDELNELRRLKSAKIDEV